MEKTNEHKISSFWYGFTFGSLTIGAVIFLLGTKKGRMTLSKILDFSENIEDNVRSLEERIKNELEKNDDSLFNDVKNLPKSFPTLTNILDKIKLRGS